MPSMNKVILMGNVGKGGVELRDLPSGGQAAQFSIATNDTSKPRDGEKKTETEWTPIVAYGRLAELCGKYLRQGSLVFVEGKKKTDRWTDCDGKKCSIVKVVIYSMQMLDKKSDDNQSKAHLLQGSGVKMEGDGHDDLPPF